MAVARVFLCGLLATIYACADGGAPGDDSSTDAQSAGNVAESARGYTQTRYPIVLAHGMSGWTQLLGVYEYFYRIPEELQAGGATVYLTSVSPFSSSEQRGEQLLAQIETIAAASGAGKVNLIGHSQGGLDARYVLAARPDLLASVTTVGTPHQGADLADWLLENVDPDGFTAIVASTLANALGFLLDALAGTDNPEDSIAALEQVSSEGMAEFNAKYPAGLPPGACASGAASWRGVALYSWGGTSPLTNILDITDAYLSVASLFASDASDGLVGRCSSHFGKILRDDYRMNHLDEVNQMVGLVSIFETNPTTVFRAHANRLKNAGL